MWDVRSIIKDSKAKIKTEQNEIDRLATLKNEKVEAVKKLGFNGPFDNADEIGVMKQEAQLKVDNAQNALTKSAARILGLEKRKQEVQPSMMRRALKAAALPLAAVLGVGAYYLNSSMGGLPDLGQADVLQSATDFVQYAWHGIGGPNAMAHVTSLAESYGIDLSSFGNNTETTDIPDGYIDPALSQAAEEAKIAAAEQAVLDDRLAQAAADEAAQESQVAQAPIPGGYVDPTSAQAAADAAAQQVAQAPATLPDLDATAGNDLAAADVQAVENDGQLQGTQEPTTNVAATETAQNNLIDGKTPSELVGEGLAAAEVLKAEALGEAVQGHIDTAQAVADATAQQANQLAAAPDITTDAPQPPADLEIANTDVGSIPNNVEPVQPASVDTLPPTMAAADSLMTVSQENPVQNIFDPSGIVDSDNNGHNDSSVVSAWVDAAEAAGVDTSLIQSLDAKLDQKYDFIMTAGSVDVMNAYCGSLQEAFNNDGVIMTSEYKDALTEGLTALKDAELVTNVSGQWDDTKLYSQESFDAATQCMNQFTNSANTVVAEAKDMTESLRPKARPGVAPVLNS